jgi:group I intron endonuclease
MGFIYKITNIVNNKSYIGLTSQSLEKRMQNHLYAISKDKGCPILGAAIKKYGIENFKMTLIIICFDSDLGYYEKEYIKKYNTQAPHGYNILEGGIGGGFQGKLHSPETKQKISNSFKTFVKNNPSYIQRLSERTKLQMQNTDVREYMNKSEKWKAALKEGRVGARAHKDGKVSDATRTKIKNSLNLYYENNIINTNTEKLGHKLQQYDSSGNIIRQYDSISEASKINNIPRSTLIKAVTSGEGTTHGYLWKKVPKQHTQ